MRYKLLAVDVDGTLLNDEDVITENTKRAIQLAEEKGIIFTISSGRSVQGIRPLLEKLELKKDHPFIAYNGAMVVMGFSEEILYRQLLSPEDSLSIYNFGQQYDTNIMVWSENKLYTNKLDEEAYKYASISNIQPRLITNPSEFFKAGATKLLWKDDAEKIQSCMKELKDKLNSTVSYYTSKPFYLEFVDSRISKAVAMEKLGEHVGVKREEMIAVGDGLNDLAMIEFAGLGVAMGNAEKAVKEKADYVTLANYEDGVAHVIEKYILSK